MGQWSIPLPSCHRQPQQSTSSGGLLSNVERVRPLLRFQTKRRWYLPRPPLACLGGGQLSADPGRREASEVSSRTSAAQEVETCRTPPRNGAGGEQTSSTPARGPDWPCDDLSFKHPEAEHHFLADPWGSPMPGPQLQRPPHHQGFLPDRGDTYPQRHKP